tara:strand:- start:79 stop:483 length:405 start_codon:yes stop_codon:yes gene_type:complete
MADNSPMTTNFASDTGLSTATKTRAPTVTDKGSAVERLKTRQKKHKTKATTPYSEASEAERAKMLGSAMGSITGSGPVQEKLAEATGGSVAQLGQAFKQQKDLRDARAEEASEEAEKNELMARYKALLELEKNA